MPTFKPETNLLLNSSLSMNCKGRLIHPASCPILLSNRNRDIIKVYKIYKKQNDHLRQIVLYFCTVWFYLHLVTFCYKQSRWPADLLHQGHIWF